MVHEEKTGCFKFGDRKWSEYVLDTSSTGLWSMVTDREMRETRMYVDRTMAKLLGLPENLTPEDCFEFWYKRINRGNYSYVNEALSKMFTTEKLCEVQYTWNHPEWGDIPVRCAGKVREMENGLFLVSGYHQNMANLDQMKRWSLNMGWQEIFEYNVTSRTALVYTDRMLTYGGQRQIRNFPQSWVEDGIVHPDFQDAFLQTFEAVKKGEEQSFCELRLKNQEREYSWFRMELEVTGSEEGSPEIILGRLDDISKQKAMETAYIRESRLNRALLGNASAYAEADITAGTVERVGGNWMFYEKASETRSYEQMILEGSRRRVYGKDRRKYIEYMDRKSLLAAFRRGSEKLECEYRRLTDQNQVCWVRHTIYLYRDPINGDVMALNCLVSIDKEKRMEEAVQGQRSAAWDSTDVESAFDRFLSQVSDMAYLVDPATHELVCGNLAFYRRLGKTGRECAGHKCYELLYDRSLPCVFCPNLKKKQVRMGIWENYNSYLNQRFLMKNRLVEWEGRTLLLAFAIDISEIKQELQGDHLQEEKSQLIGEANSRIISCLYSMAEARNAQAALDCAADVLTAHYRPSHLRFVLPRENGFGYACVSGWDGRGELGRPLEQHLEEWLSRMQPSACREVDGAQEILPESFELYQDMESQRIGEMAVIPMEIADRELGYLVMLDREKQQPLQMAETLSYFVGREIRHRKDARQLEHSIYHDSLTGLLNRSSYDRYRRDYNRDDSSSIGVICADINDLRAVNEAQGTKAGDELICRLANLLKQHFPRNQVFRLNSNEFDMILENLTEPEFEEKLEQMKATLSLTAGLSVSLGSVWDDQERNLDDVQKQAVELMRLEKQRYYENQPRTRKLGRTESLRQLLQAIERRSFRVFLQPKVFLNSGSLAGAEALIRYYDEEKGIISPAAFVGNLERENLISHIDLFVLEEVCRMMERWNQSGHALTISFNFSRITLLSNDIVRSVESIVKKYQVDRSRLEIEVTESIGELGKDTICKVLRRFGDLGYRISLDDFGTKYSNLAVLSDIRFDVLKLDKSLVSKSCDDRVSRQVVRHVISMCNDLHIRTVAEGVEEEDQERILREANCEIGQGYRYGKPMAEDEFERLWIR